MRAPRKGLRIATVQVGETGAWAVIESEEGKQVQQRCMTWRPMFPTTRRTSHGGELTREDLGRLGKVLQEVQTEKIGSMWDAVTGGANGLQTHGINGMGQMDGDDIMPKNNLRDGEMATVLNTDGFLKNQTEMMDPKENYPLAVSAVCMTRQTRKRRRSSRVRYQHHTHRFFELVKGKIIGTGRGQFVFGFMVRVSNCQQAWWDLG